MLNGHCKSAWAFNMWSRGVEPCLLLVTGLLHVHGEIPARRYWRKTRDTWWRWYRSWLERWGAPSCFFSFLRTRVLLCQKCENTSTCFNHPGEFPVSAICSALHSTRNPQRSGFVKVFGRKEFGVPREKLFLMESSMSLVSLTAVMGR